MNDDQLERARARRRKYYRSHREQELERSARWRQENPERSREIYQRFRNKHTHERMMRSLGFQYPDRTPEELGEFARRLVEQEQEA